MILLFYLASFGDEELAKRASIETYKKYKKQIKKNPHLSKKETLSYLIQITNKIWKKDKSKINENFFLNFKFWKFNIKKEIWKNFYKEASESEFLTLIWSKILNVPEQQIAKGLNLTEGTIRYRIGKSLKILGQFNQNLG